VIRPRTALIAALALLALAGASAAEAAKPAVEVRPAERFAYITMPGSEGWHLQLSAVLGTKGPQSVGIFARGPHHEEVQYIGIEGRAAENGVIESNVPGLARVAVRFEQTSETPVHFESGRCKIEGKGLDLKGIFRGTIAFHGEGGYTTIKRQSAAGRIEIKPREACPKPKHRPRPPKTTTEDLGVEYLLAGREESDRRSLTFETFGSEPKLLGGPLTAFIARYEHWRGKVMVLAQTKALGEEAGVFSLTAPEGTPTEATVNPPAPFKGTGTFKLESPTTASWTGDLSVEIPTLGTVNLAEPGFWAGACAARCTKTFPEGLSIGFQVVSRLP